MIIDTHCHYGTSLLTGRTFTGEDWLQAMDLHGVDQGLVMPHAVTESVSAAHDAVAELCDDTPRFRGIASIPALWSEQDYLAEARRCVDLGFVALKLNPLQHLTAPTWPNAEKAFRTAAECGVPLVIHTGLGGTWSLPSLAVPYARAYPTLPVVLAHAGYGLYTPDAVVAAMVCDNIWLEPSWCSVTDVQLIIDQVGTDRVMFGSDHPLNIGVELAKYHALELDPRSLHSVLGGNAQRLYLG
ncbi:MAG: amidohydrolase family protein [Actinobacteria bacterium]|nr:amidohydrolase family protein [Actinomycetota bacterium]